MGLLPENRLTVWNSKVSVSVELDADDGPDACDGDEGGFSLLVFTILDAGFTFSPRM
jgi:hypothetical protein